MFTAMGGGGAPACTPAARVAGAVEARRHGGTVPTPSAFLANSLHIAHRYELPLYYTEDAPRKCHAYLRGRVEAARPTAAGVVHAVGTCCSGLACSGLHQPGLLPLLRRL